MACGSGCGCGIGQGAVRADEGPSQADLEKFGGDSRPCPHCGADVYDDAEWCHKCGKVLGGSDQPAKPKLWVMATIAIVVLAAFFALI